MEKRADLLAGFFIKFDKIFVQIRICAFHASCQTDIFATCVGPGVMILYISSPLDLYIISANYGSCYSYFFNPVFLAARFNGVITTRTMTAATPIWTRFPGMEDTGASGFP